MLFLCYWKLKLIILILIFDFCRRESHHKSPLKYLHETWCHEIFRVNRTKWNAINQSTERLKQCTWTLRWEFMVVIGSVANHKNIYGVHNYWRKALHSLSWTVNIFFLILHENIFYITFQAQTVLIIDH